MHIVLERGIVLLMFSSRFQCYWRFRSWPEHFQQFSGSHCEGSNFRSLAGKLQSCQRIHNCTVFVVGFPRHVRKGWGLPRGLQSYRDLQCEAIKPCIVIYSAFDQRLREGS
jgi:hypothetical protein